MTKAYEVVPNLFISPHPGHNEPYPERLDVIVNLSAYMGMAAPDRKVLVHWPIDDGPMWDPSGVRAVAHYVAEQVKRAKRVLVHCDAGLNRSGMVVARALISLGWDAKDAIEWVRFKREDEMVLCNGSFETWLYGEPAGS